MKTYLMLEKRTRFELPDWYRGPDYRFQDTLVAHFIREYTSEGDVVFDPFAGFGTALLVAESMGRQGYGIEYDRARALHIKSMLERPERLVHGDSRNILSMDLPRFDLTITSPPYPFMGDDPFDDPFTDYTERGSDYGDYLESLKGIFSQIRSLMKPGARIVVEAGNLKLEGGLTTLAWDIAGKLSEVLRFEGEVVECRDHSDFGYDHGYCLVFTA